MQTVIFNYCLDIAERKIKTMFLKQIESLRMYEAVLDHVKKNPVILEIIPEFAVSLEILESNIRLIKMAVKKNKEEEADRINERLEVKKRICRAGADLEMLLAERSKLQFSSEESSLFYLALLATKDHFLLEKLQELHDLGICDLPYLKKFGITADILVAFQKMIHSYHKSTTYDNSSAAMRRFFRNLFKETDRMLLEMDKLAKKLRKKEHHYFAVDYESRRSICTIESSFKN